MGKVGLGFSRRCEWSWSRPGDAFTASRIKGRRGKLGHLSQENWGKNTGVQISRDRKATDGLPSDLVLSRMKKGEASGEVISQPLDVVGARRKPIGSKPLRLGD